MMKVCYSEMDTPAGLSCRLEAAGHAGYAPAGQDIVCAGASTVMQGLVYLLAGEENAHSEAFDEPDGPRLAVSVDAPCEEWVRGAFELAKACFVLLAERYPENVRFADVSRRGKESMMDLQLFASEGGDAASAPPALSEAQTRQAVASGTMKPDEAKVPAAPQASAEKTVELQPEKPRQELPVQRSELPPLSSFARSTQAAVHSLHARWAAEEAAMRRSQPDFDLQNELRSPEMRRLMQLPGMRVRDAYRLAHYDENLRTAAQAVEQGVVERIQQRAARPTENGIRPGGAATVRPDVASMTRAQREALERRVLHGAQIEL
ncbi:ribosomal-processing cysteine protease Prp [Faecalibacterium taiwanense]|uniref:ribosomal-processing cysteine protease Prp n=1 Tax=Faecalibacterium taiwanense TaxID=3030638 RepID=UPI003AB1052E